MGEEKRRRTVLSPDTMDEWAERAKAGLDDRERQIYQALEARGFEPFGGRPGYTAEAEAIQFIFRYTDPVKTTAMFLAGDRFLRAFEDGLHKAVPALARNNGEADKAAASSGEAGKAAASGGEGGKAPQHRGFKGSAADVDFERRAFKVSTASIDYLNRLCAEFGLAPYRDVDVLDEAAVKNGDDREYRKLQRRALERLNGGDE